MPVRALLSFLAAALVGGPALAQDGLPQGDPLDPALNGTWEMVEMNVLGAEPDAELVEMTVTFDGDTATTAQTFRVDGELREEVDTHACTTIDGMIACVSTGDRPGRHGGFGIPEVDGGTLRFSLPDGQTFAVFRRVEG